LLVQNPGSCSLVDHPVRVLRLRGLGFVRPPSAQRYKLRGDIPGGLGGGLDAAGKAISGGFLLLEPGERAAALQPDGVA